MYGNKYLKMTYLSDTFSAVNLENVNEMLTKMTTFLECLELSLM